MDFCIKIFRLLYVSIISGCFCFCANAPIVEDPSSFCDVEDTDNLIPFREGATLLGKQIEIPYTIDNLRRAYNELDQVTKSAIDVTCLKPTHYYVRFMPRSWDELDILKVLYHI